MGKVYFVTARDSMSTAVAGRRRQRDALWQDSSFFQDSFFGADTRSDMPSEFGSLRNDLPARDREHPGDATPRPFEPPVPPPVRH